MELDFCIVAALNFTITIRKRYRKLYTNCYYLTLIQRVEMIMEQVFTATFDLASLSDCSYFFDVVPPAPQLPTDPSASTSSRPLHEE